MIIENDIHITSYQLKGIILIIPGQREDVRIAGNTQQCFLDSTSLIDNLIEKPFCLHTRFALYHKELIAFSKDHIQFIVMSDTSP